MNASNVHRGHYVLQVQSELTPLLHANKKGHALSMSCQRLMTMCVLSKMVSFTNHIQSTLLIKANCAKCQMILDPYKLLTVTTVNQVITLTMFQVMFINALCVKQGLILIWKNLNYSKANWLLRNVAPAQ